MLSSIDTVTRYAICVGFLFNPTDMNKYDKTEYSFSFTLADTNDVYIVTLIVSEIIFVIRAFISNMTMYVEILI